MKNSLIKSILIYIVFFIIIYILYETKKIEVYNIYLILIFVWIIIKDLLLYFVDKDKKYLKKFDKSKLYKDFKRSRIWFIDFTIISNRNIFFPIILVIYMIYLLTWQIHLFWLDKKWLFLWINQNYLLWITIFSWILTVFKENKDEKYFYEELEWWIFSKNIILTILLSLFGTYIIFNQVVKLGLLSYPISIISGLLIFLVWISILEDDEDLENS